MTRDDLLKMLDIAPQPSADDGAMLEETGAGGPCAAPASPTALVLDDWSMRRGREMLETSEILQRTIPEARDCRQEAAADFLAAAFEPSPKLAESCTDETRHRFLKSLMETEQYSALHKQTQLDALASELAAGHFAQGWAQLVEEEEQQNPPDGPPGQPGGSGGGFKADMRALAAAGDALEAAQQDVDDLQDMQSAMGLGSGGGSDGKLDLAGVRDRFAKMRRSGSLRRIVELAGRYRRMAQARQRQKTLHGRDDVVGVTLDNDLGRLLPQELACLDDPDLELDAMRRFLERSMMCRDYRGVESKAAGPIVVVVDESGSMDGEPIANAKAFALAMGWIARHQRRWICFVGFSGGTEGTYLAMPPGRWDQIALMDWLEHFFGGGTDMDVPLVELPKRWQALGCPEGKTDIIQITDAICRVPNEMRDNFLAWKTAHQVKYYTIVIGDRRADGGDLKAISDRVWCMPNLGIEEEGVQELMSL